MAPRHKYDRVTDYLVSASSGREDKLAIAFLGVVLVALSALAWVIVQLV